MATRTYLQASFSSQWLMLFAAPGNLETKKKSAGMAFPLGPHTLRLKGCCSSLLQAKNQ